MFLLLLVGSVGATSISLERFGASAVEEYAADEHRRIATLVVISTAAVLMKFEKQKDECMQRNIVAFEHVKIIAEELLVNRYADISLSLVIIALDNALNKWTACYGDQVAKPNCWHMAVRRSVEINDELRKVINDVNEFYEKYTIKDDEIVSAINPIIDSVKRAAANVSWRLLRSNIDCSKFTFKALEATFTNKFARLGETEYQVASRLMAEFNFAVHMTRTTCTKKFPLHLANIVSSASAKYLLISSVLADVHLAAAIKQHAFVQKTLKGY